MSDLAEIFAELERKVVRPAYVLMGSETWLIERAVKLIKELASPNAIAGFNDDLFQGKESSASKIIGAARTMPMMGDKRFVLVRGADNLASAELEPLAAYIEEPAAHACLVLVAEKFDARSKIIKTAKAKGALFETAELKPPQVARFIESECARRKQKIDGRATHALSDAIGADLSLLADSLDRLSLYVDGGPITVEAVEACIAHSRTDSIWSLVDAISQKNRKVALTATASLLDDREPPLRILAMITRQLKMLARMKSELSLGAPPADAAKSAGVPPFKANEMAGSAKRFSADDLSRAFVLLLDTDLALKGSKRQPEHVLEETVLALCR